MRQMAFLTGYQPQEISAPHGPQLNFQVNQFATPLLMNESGPHRGVIITAGFMVAGTNFNTLTGALNVSFDYAFDGATTPTAIPLYTWDGSYNRWSPQARAMAISLNGEGYTQGDYLVLWMGITFRYACIVRLVCNSAPDGGVPRLAHAMCMWMKAQDA